MPHSKHVLKIRLSSNVDAVLFWAWLRHVGSESFLIFSEFCFSFRWCSGSSWMIMVKHFRFYIISSEWLWLIQMYGMYGNIGFICWLLHVHVWSLFSFSLSLISLFLVVQVLSSYLQFPITVTSYWHLKQRKFRIGLAFISCSWPLV